VKDAYGKVINHVKAPAKKGIHRVNWDLRYASKNIMDPEKGDTLQVESKGYMVTPGVYSASLYALNKGEVNQLSEAVSFNIKPLHEQVLEPSTPAEIEEFRKALETALLEYGTVKKVLQETSKRLTVLKNACFRMEDDAGDLLEEVYRTEAEVQKLNEMLNGKQTKGQVGEQEAATLETRWYVAEMGLSTSYGPTTMHKESLQTGIEEMKPIREQVRTLKNTTLPALEEKLRNAGAPITKAL
jgi:chromosome segregation ATPase